MKKKKADFVFWLLLPISVTSVIIGILGKILMWIGILQGLPKP